MRILLVDDHELFREGLKWLLSGLDGHLQFVEAGSLEGIASLAKQGDDVFDIVLLDLYLPDSEGLKSLRLARDMLPDATTVVLSSRDDPRFVGAAMQQGAAGFVPKSSTREVLIAALRLILAGGVYLPPHVLGSDAASAEPDPAPDADAHQPQEAALQHLTARQRDVLKLAVEGKVNKIIARELDISEATVKAHLSASFRALGVKNRTEASFKVAELDWFS